MSSGSSPSVRKPEVFAFVNQKGGCGKTTTAVHLAGALAARGERVLLVDLDPQAHATMALGHAAEAPTVADVLLEGADIRRAIVAAPGGIRLLPSVPRLGRLEEVAEHELGPERRLSGALALVAADYEYVLIDCPPRADGVLCANALHACTYALLVVETGAFALQGALQALRILDDVGADIGRTFDVRVVATMFDRRTRIGRELLIALQARFGDALFETAIRTSVRLREAPALGLPVQVLDPACRASLDFAALADEVVALARAGGRPDRVQPRQGATDTLPLAVPPAPHGAAARRSAPALAPSPRAAPAPLADPAPDYPASGPATPRRSTPRS
jgi:chromosome partitioning protein